MRCTAILLSLLLLTLGVAAEDDFTITVSGEGTIFVPADTVLVSVGVASSVQSDENVTLASENNAKKLNDTIKALIDSGLDEEAVLSDRSSSCETIQFYSKVCNNSTCTVEEKVINQISDRATLQLDADDESLKQYLQIAEDEGASASVIGYRLSDTESAMAEARKKAMDNAKDGAEELAFIANLKLGNIVDIYEPMAPQIYRRPWGGFNMFGYSRWMTNIFDRPSYDRPFARPSSSGSEVMAVTSYVVVTYKVSP